jgi:drug/metabolite transporter (DMT)-like permease
MTSGSYELLKTRLLTLLVIASNVAGNLSLSHGMREVGALTSFSPLPYLHAILNPWVGGGVVMLAFWMFSDLVLLSRADLSYVLPVTSMAYVLIALLGHFVLHEAVSIARWTGIVVISAGVILVGETNPRTAPEEGDEEE